MKPPVSKNRSWMSLLHKSIGGLDERRQAEIMKPCGQGCASDILSLCEKHLGRKVDSLEDLVAGWNAIREERGLTGRWKLEPDAVRGVFGECGCPLVRSGLIELHPVQCHCSRGMMEAIFSAAARRPVEVELRKTIGRGDEVCHFLIKPLQAENLNLIAPSPARLSSPLVAFMSPRRPPVPSSAFPGRSAAYPKNTPPG